MAKESDLLLANQLKMKKYIEISEETVNALLQGKRVEGSLRMTERGLAFKTYQRKPRVYNNAPDILLYRSANGWLKESKQRRKIWISVPSDMGMCRDAVTMLAECREMAEYLNERGEEMEGGCQ